MKEEEYNPLKGLNFSVLDDHEYKEDAVREDMISPIIKALGYSSKGTNKIVRNRNFSILSYQ